MINVISYAKRVFRDTSKKIFFKVDTTNRKLQIFDTDGVTVREEIDGNGFKQTRYRDEYAGGSYVAAAAAAAPDEVQYTIGGVGTRMYSFDGNVTEERLSNSFEMAHDIDFDALNAETLFLEAHVHFMPSTNNAGDVEWFFDYTYIPLNAAPIVQSSLVGLCTVAANEQYHHKICAFKNGLVVKIPKPASGFGIGDIILFTLRRTPTGTNDTYTDDAILIKVALHVPTNDFGSRQRYIK